ncbi:ring finger and CHY zinc finger domain containing 1 [Rhipicephalus microplus]|uniref:ring finger and CHY zinc finger domain containing 1 n=1 Tax=Rhipicephalus microplus TaxID=6941 RepID=UPI003F6CF04B
MSQGASGNTERDTHDAVGVDPEASTRSRRLQPAVHDDRTGKSEDTSKREVRDAVRSPFFRRRGLPGRTKGSGNAPESVPCKFFSRNGQCWNGDRCRYSHSLGQSSSAATSAASTVTAVNTDGLVKKEVEDVPDDCAPLSGCVPQLIGDQEYVCADKSAQRSPPKELCRFFERHGFCRYGRGCRYVHKCRRDRQVKSTAPAPQEATVNDLPKQGSDVQDSLASDQTPTGAVSKVENGGSAQHPPSEEELLKQLRDREIDQFRKRFRKSKKVPAVDGVDKYIFVFGPTDPDWPFDVKELTMMVAFPKLYPRECLMICVLDEEGVLPPTLLRDINAAVKAWLDEKHSTANQVRPGLLCLRPFLRWLDRNLETLFIESLRKVKKIQLAEAAGLEFVPFEQLAGATAKGEMPTVNEALSRENMSSGDVVCAMITSNADNIQEKECQGTLQDEALTDCLQVLTLDSSGKEGRLIDCPPGISINQSSDCNEQAHGATSVLNGFGVYESAKTLSGTENNRHGKKEKNVTNELDESGPAEKPHHVASSVLEGGSSENSAAAAADKCTHRAGVDIHVNQKKGTEVKFRRLELGEGVATLECTKVAVRVQCGRCRCNADVVTPARRRNVVTCGRCSRTCSVTFRPNLMHPFNSVMGYFDLVDCFAVDLVLSGCVFSLDCFGCNKRMTADGIHYGQRRSLWCQFCNAKMTVLMESVKFLQLQPSKAAENAGSAFSIKAPKMIKKFKDPAIQEGKPLPEGGICKHYKKSFRWLRFPCCGKAYPCDKCHDEQEGGSHEMKYATRMICGHCCKEQPFAAEKPCTGCANFMTKKPTAHWEGGRGCRDRIRMSRDDNKKFSGTGKTISKRAQEKLSGKK